MTREAMSPGGSPRISPIAIFIYRRPDKLRNMLCGLKQCIGFDQSQVIVFADGPRSDVDRLEVERARNVAIELLGEFISDSNVSTEASSVKITPDRYSAVSRYGSCPISR
jgi:hypothetical protein